jgi:hypothetical protein
VSILDLVHARLLILHPLSSTSADATGQLFSDATGQPIGDATDQTNVADDNWEDLGVEVYGRVEERSGKWPEGPGAGPELVDAKIWLPFGTDVDELDKIQNADADPAQVYQVVFRNPDVGSGRHHLQVKARRIPL